MQFLQSRLLQFSLSIGTVDDYLGRVDVGGQLKHGVIENGFHDGAQPARAHLELNGFLHYEIKHFVLDDQVDVVHSKEFLELFYQSILGFGENTFQRICIKRIEVGDDRQTTNNFGNQAIFFQVGGRQVLQHVVLVQSLVAACTIANDVSAFACSDKSLNTIEGSTSDEKDVFRVDSNHLLLGVFASALWRYVDDRAFQQLQHGLLDTFTRHIAGNAGIVALAGNLVNLINENDASFRSLHVVIGGLQQLNEDILHIFAHVTSLGEHGGIGNSERNVEHLGNSAS